MLSFYFYYLLTRIFVKKLVVAKYIVNNIESAIIKLFPFFIIKNLHLYISLKIVNFSIKNICIQIFK